jgi:hypothetical protein
MKFPILKSHAISPLSSGDSTFNGFDTKRFDHYSAVEKLSVERVAYLKEKQDHTSLKSLVSGVFSHFWVLVGYTNTQSILRDLDLAFHRNEPTGLQFERRITSNNPFLQVALAMCDPMLTRADYEDELMNSARYAAEYAAKTPEQHAAEEEQLHREILDTVNSPAFNEKQALNLFRCKTLLLAALGDRTSNVTLNSDIAIANPSL